MTNRYVHYLPGGGLGDVFREAYFNNALGILKRWKLQHPDAHLTVALMSHNPASADLLAGQPWIDAVTPLYFPLEQTWEWEAAYTLYPAVFADCTELRFLVADTRSLYSANFTSHRPRSRHAQTIPAVGTAWEFPLSQDEHAEVYGDSYTWRDFVFHPFAGQASRALPDDLTKLVRHALASRHVTIGASYTRPEHEDESGYAASPRVLAAGLRKARAVVATESSVYYMASMLGTPTLCFYGQDTALDKLLNRGDRSWDWYFNLTDPRSLFVPLYDWKSRWADLDRWFASHG